MKKSIQDIVALLCLAVLICTWGCATAKKSRPVDKSNQKIKNENPLKPIPEAIGPPKNRVNTIEQNKPIWGPQKRFLDSKSTQEKIEIWTIEPEK